MIKPFAQFEGITQREAQQDITSLSRELSSYQRQEREESSFIELMSEFNMTPDEIELRLADNLAY